MNFSVIRIVESNFPTLEKAQQQEVVATVGSGIPQEERVISPSTACSRAWTRARSSRKNVEGVKADPPTVFFSKTSAVLVNLDGDPMTRCSASSGFDSSQLDRDARARGEGTTRTRDYGSVRSGASSRSGTWIAPAAAVSAAVADAGDSPQEHGH